MPVIKVEMFSGRTIEQRRKLVKALTDSFVETCGGTPQSVQVVIQDVDKSYWGAGGELCSDLYPDAASAEPGKS